MPPCSVAVGARLLGERVGETPIGAIGRQGILPDGTTRPRTYFGGCTFNCAMTPVGHVGSPQRRRRLAGSAHACQRDKQESSDWVPAGLVVQRGDALAFS